MAQKRHTMSFTDEQISALDDALAYYLLARGSDTHGQGEDEANTVEVVRGISERVSDKYALTELAR